MRLAQAAVGAQDGQVIQFLAGVPELMARYRNAPPAAKALIHVAMDGRRLGMRLGLPQAFLKAAAPGYMTGAEWDALGGDWLEQALAYAAVPSKGVRGPLTPIRPRPARSRTTGPGSEDSDQQLADGLIGISAGPLYRLADYLDQYGRHHREGLFPPVGFWAAAADHACPSDQAVLGDAADARGLYRDAAQLHKNAAACGNLRAVYYLSNAPQYLRGDVRPVLWAAAYASLDDPAAVTALLGRLREAGAEQQATALLHRDPAAYVCLDDPRAVATLLASLREAGAEQQATALADRAAAHLPLDDGRAAARLREADAEQQTTALADRAAALVSLDDPFAVARLLGSLREAGEQEQATALAQRAAALMSLDDPFAVAWLLGSLREADAEQQATTLLHRDPAAHVSLDNPLAVAELLSRLREAGAEQQATALADRAAAYAPLDDPDAMAGLLDSLREAGAEQQATALADRAAAHVCLDNPRAVATLLDSLREAGAEQQATALADRLPPAGMFELFREQQDRQDRFRFGREADGSPAQPWRWEDLD